MSESLGQAADAAEGETIRVPRNIMGLLRQSYDSREKMLELLASAEKAICILDAKVQDQEAIGLLLRKLSGWGKPRQGQGRNHGVLAPPPAVHRLFRALRRWATGFCAPVCPGIMTTPVGMPLSSRVVSATGC